MSDGKFYLHISKSYTFFVSTVFYVLHIRIKVPPGKLYNRETTSPLRYSIAWMGIKCIHEILSHKRHKVGMVA